jgi:hypothetical protein
MEERDGRKRETIGNLMRLVLAVIAVIAGFYLDLE